MRKLIICTFLFVISLSVYSIDITKYDRIYNHFKNYPSRSLSSLGESYYKSGLLDSALVCFSIISASYIPDAPKENSQLYAHAYNRCGVIYLQYNSYIKALNMFFKGLEICENTGDERYIPKILNNVASIYYLFRDYRTAESYCEKAYEMGLKYNDKEIQKTLLNNMIGINCYLREYSKAKAHLEQLELLKPEKNSPFNYYLCISNGALKLEEYKHEDALSWFKKAIAYVSYCPNPERLRYVAFSNISKAFQYSHRYDSALVYLKKGESIAFAYKYEDLRYECYNDFSELYQKMGNEQLSLFYKRKSLAIADSIFNIQEFGQIKDMQFLHEMDKIEEQIYRLNDAQMLKDNQIKSQQRILQIIICALIIIIILSIIMYLQNRRLREANVELFNKNLEIIKSEEKEKMSRKGLADTAPPPVLPDPAEQAEESLVNNENSDSQDFLNSKIKYQNSVINESEKRRIREAIQDVMDNTLEYCVGGNLLY